MEKQHITQEEINEQVRLIKERGHKIVDYLNKYKGHSVYNEIALAIEFGYQLCIEDINEPKKNIYDKQ